MNEPVTRGQKLINARRQVFARVVDRAIVKIASLGC